MNFQLVRDLRSWSNQAFEIQIFRKTNKACDLLGCFSSLFKKCIFHQLFVSMNIDKNSSVWCIDCYIPTASFSFLNRNEMSMFIKENNYDKSEIDGRFYIMQETKPNFFLKLKEEERHLNFLWLNILISTYKKFIQAIEFHTITSLKSEILISWTCLITKFQLLKALD